MNKIPCIDRRQSSLPRKRINWPANASSRVSITFLFSANVLLERPSLCALSQRIDLAQGVQQLLKNDHTSLVLCLCILELLACNTMTVSPIVFLWC
jgi:hypothetical protein